MMIFSLFVFIAAYRISGFSSISSPGMYPMIAAAVMVLSMALILLNNRKLAKPDADGFKDEMQQAARRVLPPIFLIYTAIVVGYMLLIEPLHFLPSSLVFLMVSMIYLNTLNPQHPTGLRKSPVFCPRRHGSLPGPLPVLNQL